jgi:hypothetical protein
MLTHIHARMLSTRGFLRIRMRKEQLLRDCGLPMLPLQLRQEHLLVAFH